MDSFAYGPLSEGEIRVLTVQPSGSAGADAPLMIDLEHVILESEDRDYEALSYVWGESANLHPVACGDGTLNITTNLQQALRFSIWSLFLAYMLWHSLRLVCSTRSVAISIRTGRSGYE